MSYGKHGGVGRDEIPPVFPATRDRPFTLGVSGRSHGAEDDTVHDKWPSLPPLGSLALLLHPSRCPCPLAVRSGWLFGVAGGGDANIGPCPLAFPLGVAEVCTPCQGVTLLYRRSICTRFVQMDLRCSQVLRPFPTPGPGILWVVGEP